MKPSAVTVLQVVPLDSLSLPFLLTRKPSPSTIMFITWVISFPTQGALIRHAAGQDLNTVTGNDRSPCRVKDSAHKGLQWLGQPLGCSTLDSPPQVQALELSPNSRQPDQFRETLAPRSAPVWTKYPGGLC